jgi:hypothetical protein
VIFTPELVEGSPPLQDIRTGIAAHLHEGIGDGGASGVWPGGRMKRRLVVVGGYQSVVRAAGGLR